ncbi:hypothetical protein [Olleya sp.]|jgi:hypothetical protein|uniref:hypothetical protein n=1 Tax=Olleya sp. TaxID=1906788 RepID=UPI0032D9A726
MSRQNIGFELKLRQGEKLKKLELSDKVKKQIHKQTGKNYTAYLKEFIGNEKDFNILNKAFDNAMQKSLPNDIEEHCLFCKKQSDDFGDKLCQKYYLQMNITFMMASNEFISLVSQNKHIYNDKSSLKKLTAKFFDCFRFIKGEGKMFLDVDRLCRFTLECGFLAITNMFAKSDTLSNLKIINSTLNEIDEKDLNNKINQSEDDNYLELQRVFFESKRRFYKDEIFINEREKPIPNPQKKLDIKQPTVVHYVLYYNYLQQSKDFGYFENHPEGKVTAIKNLIKDEGLKTTYKYFQLKYNHFTNYPSNRIAQNQVANISYVANTMLQAFPEAQKIALLELEKAILKSR